MSYTVEGYLRELPQEAQTSLGSVKKLELNVTDPEQIKKLDNIFNGYRMHHASWIPPRRLGGKEAYGIFLKLNTPGFLPKVTIESLRLPLDKWLNRPAKVRFSIKSYRFINQQGVVIIGGTAQLTTFEFMVLE
jgi:hypothetical protein